MKRLQTATWEHQFSGMNEGEYYLVGSYTADADREMGINVYARGKDLYAFTTVDFMLFVTITRSPFSESYRERYSSTYPGWYAGNCSPGDGVGTEKLLSANAAAGAWTIPGRHFYVAAGDVVNVYLTQGADQNFAGEGFIEFYGTETVEEIVAAVWGAQTSGNTNGYTMGEAVILANNGTPPSANEIATQILATPANKLVTDASGRVTAGTVADKTGYALTPAYDAAKSAASQASVDDLPTNTELATALAGADDAVLAAIAALNNLSAAGAQAAAAAALVAYGAAKVTDLPNVPTAEEIDAQLSETHGTGAWGGSGTGGSGLTVQQVRDAMKLAPSAGAPATGSIDKQLDDIQAQTDRIGDGTIMVVAPVLVSGDVILDWGYDYYDVDNRALVWIDDTPATLPDLTDATVTFRAGNLAVVASVSNPTGPATITVELSKVQTNSLAVGVHLFELDAVLANQHTVLLTKGRLRVV